MTIDIVKNGAIATGDVYAQPHKVGVLWDAYLIKPKSETISEDVLFFLATALEKSIKKKFSYDDKCIWSKVSQLYVYLPAINDETPNYEYMESYIANIRQRASMTLNSLVATNRSWGVPNEVFVRLGVQIHCSLRLNTLLSFCSSYL